MNIKLICIHLLVVIFSIMGSYTLAQEIIINDCGNMCQGHVFTGNENIHVISGSHHVKLNGACIDVSEQNGVAAFAIERNAEVFLTLENENVLSSGAGCAGIQVPYTATLIITEDSTGAITAIGGLKGAGIGGGNEECCGTIVIEGGFVNAIGAMHDYCAGGAGIGGGYYGDGGDISIFGGVVNATGGNGGAGIGGGYLGDGGEISITGGIVNAGDSYAQIGGAGIGGGTYGFGGWIYINGGIVTAGTSYYEGCYTGAGIGGGAEGGGGNIVIENGLVYARAGCGAAGIGAAGDDLGSCIEIHGGFIEAYGGEKGGAGIGGGYNFETEVYSDILITGGTTIAQGGCTPYDRPGGAGIGGSGGRSNPPVNITGGYIYAMAGTGGSSGGAGIGSGGCANAEAILIKGGMIIADANASDETGYGGAGIGSGGNAFANDIVILGGRISAKGGGAGAGIGSGERKSSVIQISGGSVDASNGKVDTDAIIGELEYAQGEVVSNGEALKPNVEEIIDYAI